MSPLFSQMSPLFLEPWDIVPSYEISRQNTAVYMNPGRFGPISVRSGRFGSISRVSRFGPCGVGPFGPLSKVGCFGPILGVSHFGLIKFCVYGGRGWKDWLDVEFHFDKTGKSTLMYVMVSAVEYLKVHMTQGSRGSPWMRKNRSGR